MANPVGILIGSTGLVVSAIGGLALGQYAVSGVDPTKAAAYASYDDDLDTASAIDASDTRPVAYTEPSIAALDAGSTLY